LAGEKRKKSSSDDSRMSSIEVATLKLIEVVPHPENSIA
jgi:hypothetical protein